MNDTLHKNRFPASMGMLNLPLSQSPWHSPRGRSGSHEIFSISSIGPVGLGWYVGAFVGCVGAEVGIAVGEPVGAAVGGSVGKLYPSP